MKILQVIPTLDPSVGGVAPAMMALSRGLVRRGHEVEIAVLDDATAEWLAAIELAVHAVGTGLTTYRYSSALRNWLKQNAQRFDRIIVNGLWQYPGLAVWRCIANTKTRYYVFPHGMLDPWFKRTYPVKHLKKWLYWPWAEYRVLRDATAVIFTSEQERVEARESFSLYRAREKVCPLGLEPPPPVTSAVRQMLFQQFPQLRGTRPLLLLGRLHPKKGCDLAIEALAAVADQAKEFSLVLAGPDQIGWRAKLERRTNELRLSSRVVFAGMLQGELKQSALANVDALILPSHQENFGMAVVEALAMGLPVLISDQINISQQIVAADAGYVASDDLEGTTSLIERWCKTSEQKKEQMRLNAKDCFARHYHIDRAVDSLLDILLEPAPAEAAAEVLSGSPRLG